MSQEPEPLDFPNAEPVTVEQALVVVDDWRDSGMPLYGLHQIGIALAEAYRALDMAYSIILLAYREEQAERLATLAEVKRQREEIETLEAVAANDEGYTECVEGAFHELCQAAGVSAGRIPGRDVEGDPENWEPWIAGVREKFARLERERRGLSAYRDSLLILLDAARAETAGLLIEAERNNAAMLRLADAALGCSEGMACRRPVWFGCCATRKRICEVLGVEFHVERASSADSSVIDDVGPRAATVPGDAG